MRTENGFSTRTAKIGKKKEKITIERTIDVMEVDLDFTQLYNCFLLLSMKVKTGTAFHVMFFMLHNMDKGNMINVNDKVIQQFNVLYEQMGNKGISKQYFYTLLRELQTAEIVEKMSKGQYFLNIYAMWKSDKKKRMDYIEAEHKDGQKVFKNPMTMLLPEAVNKEYKIDSQEEDMTVREMEQNYGYVEIEQE